MPINHRTPSTNQPHTETQRGVDLRIAVARAALRCAQEAYDANPSAGTLEALLRARADFERLRGIPLPSLAEVR